MSIDTFPPELVLCIAKYINKDWVSDDIIDDLEDEINKANDKSRAVELKNLKDLLIETATDFCEYYPLWNLYATCKSFSWLSELEYICIENGEFYANISTRNINGLYHGLTINGSSCTGLLGYTFYDNGKIIKENSMYTDSAYFYRCVNGVVYYEDRDCNRWHNDCNIECKTCSQLNNIQEKLFNEDTVLQLIFKSDHENGYIIIRTPKVLININKLEYCIDGLVLATDNED